MKKVISFSLWGNDPRYCTGAVRNALAAHKHYPDWTCRFYVDYETVPCAIVMSLALLPNAELFEMIPGVPKMMQRFMVHDDPEVGRYLIRDADSRIGPEEVAAVEEWIREDTILHTCRAHPAHARPINGGMWGLTPRRDNWEAPQMEHLIKDFLTRTSIDAEQYGEDQVFLTSHIWGWCAKSVTQHDAVSRNFYGGKPFPVKWPWPRFMGEVFLIDPVTGGDVPRDGDYQQIKKDNE